MHLAKVRDNSPNRSNEGQEAESARQHGVMDFMVSPTFGSGPGAPSVGPVIGIGRRRPVQSLIVVKLRLVFWCIFVPKPKIEERVWWPMPPHAVSMVRQFLHLTPGRQGLPRREKCISCSATRNAPVWPSLHPSCGSRKAPKYNARESPPTR